MCSTRSPTWSRSRWSSPKTAADGAMRYRLLETLRQYGRERLDAAGEADRWRRGHAEHYATVAEAAGEGLRGPRRVRLDTEPARRSRQRPRRGELVIRPRRSCRRRVRVADHRARSLSTSTSSAPRSVKWAQRATTRVADTTPEHRGAVLFAAARFPGLHPWELGGRRGGWRSTCSVSRTRLLVTLRAATEHWRIASPRRDVSTKRSDGQLSWPVMLRRSAPTATTGSVRTARTRCTPGWPATTPRPASRPTPGSGPPAC